MIKIIKKVVKTTRQKKGNELNKKFIREMKIFYNFVLNVEKREKRTIIIKFKIIRFRYSRSHLMLQKSTL